MKSPCREVLNFICGYVIKRLTHDSTAPRCLITILLSSRLAEGHTGGEPVKRPFPVGCTTPVLGGLCVNKTVKRPRRTLRTSYNRCGPNSSQKPEPRHAKQNLAGFCCKSLATLPGTKGSARRCAQHDAPPLLFVHGHPLSVPVSGRIASVWRHTAPRWRPQRRCER